MAIGTNDGVYKYGTQTEVINVAGSDITNTNFSDSGDNTEWTNSDDAPMAAFVWDITMSAAPTANTTIDLFGQAMNIADTTEDANAPSSTFEHMYLGSFPMDSGGTAQRGHIVVDLPFTLSNGASTAWDFYIKNNSGHTIKTGSVVDVIPLAIGPAA